ncbi:YdiU family protein [Comamonas sp. NLF-1-9]|nr:YdiU family protein [Comamonas sp. NLF-1-9]QXL85433.1 YdiU family protein [Comamonas sp. NLF-1-9]
MDMRATPAPEARGPAWQAGFATLGEPFFTALAPSPLPEPHWIARNRELAAELGLEPAWLDSDQALQALSGNATLPGSTPLASVYGGHQFGVWAGRLGDGRALLLGETAQGQELQLKGSGRTPYSRGADGRAVLRSSIREYLASCAMHGLAIPSTQALALVGSPLPVQRETLESAAVLTRVAPSFIRFGHFEWFAAQGQEPALRRLADYVIERYYPACRTADAAQGNAYAALLRAVSERTAALIAQWQAVGFMHGVMNTDNMSILGLTLDYGPFQFMDGFDPQHICNHSDQLGRYAFDEQPAVAHWNLACLARALLPLIEELPHAQAAISAYPGAFEAHYMAQMRRKLGLSAPFEGDAESLAQLLRLLAREGVDYSIFWRSYSQACASGTPKAAADLFIDRTAFHDWLLAFSELLAQAGIVQNPDLMLKTNPKFVLRNHLAELCIRAAKLQDFSVIEALQQVLMRPFDDHPDHQAWAGPPPDWAASLTLSCSS